MLTCVCSCQPDKKDDYITVSPGYWNPSSNVNIDLRPLLPATVRPTLDAWPGPELLHNLTLEGKQAVQDAYKRVVRDHNYYERSEEHHV